MKTPEKTRTRLRPVAATYSRTSNPDDPREESIETQEAAQVAMWQALGWEVPREFRVQEKFSGMETLHDRPELGRLRDLAAAGLIDGMSAYDTHRLARDPDDLLAIVRDNSRLRVETRFVMWDHDAQSRIGRMTLYMTGFAGAMQCDWIAEATQRVKRRIIDRGQLVGVGPRKYGYNWVKETRSRPANPDTAPHVRWMFESAAGGMSAQAMARDLNARGVPTPFAYLGHKRAGTRWRGSAVAAIIRDRTYLGEAVARRTMPGTGRYKNGKRRQVPRPVADRVPLSDARTEALVSPGLFDRANRALDAAVTHGGRPSRKGEYLLRGKLFCAECGHRMAPQDRMMKAYGTDRRYRCRSYRCVGHKRDDAATCWATAGALSTEAMAWAALVRDVADVGYIEGLIEDEIRRLEAEEGKGRLAADIAAAESRRKAVDREIRRAVDGQLKARGAVARILAEKAEALGVEADDLDRQLAAWRQRLESRGDRRREVQGTLEMLDVVRTEIRSGIEGTEKRRKVVEMLGATFRTRLRDGERELWMELPYGVLDVNCAGSSSRISPFYVIQLRSA